MPSLQFNIPLFELLNLFLSLPIFLARYFDHSFSISSAIFFKTWPGIVALSLLEYSVSSQTSLTDFLESQQGLTRIRFLNHPISLAVCLFFCMKVCSNFHYLLISLTFTVSIAIQKSAMSAEQCGEPWSLPHLYSLRVISKT